MHGMKQPIRIHMLAGNDEYTAEASLGKLAAHLTQRLAASCSISRAKDCGTELPELGPLATADVLVIFCKRIRLPDDQLETIRAWCHTGRPVSGKGRF